MLILARLEATDSGDKIAAKAIGPILQAPARPAHDLSRGCTADDAHRLIAVAAARTRER